MSGVARSPACQGLPSGGLAKRKRRLGRHGRRRPIVTTRRGGSSFAIAERSRLSAQKVVRRPRIPVTRWQVRADLPICITGPRSRRRRRSSLDAGRLALHDASGDTTSNMLANTAIVGSQGFVPNADSRYWLFFMPMPILCTYLSVIAKCIRLHNKRKRIGVPVPNAVMPLERAAARVRPVQSLSARHRLQQVRPIALRR